ncbi:uncharacterized protein EI97DRAFT_431663 [Westerdykella ornata]|uniref:Zn(2)-C6 fungal-type domain-containing protein n=1 Tax=Westerdykella ornata TaxID=318751 RepID=A0A6A6JQC1_WESOR|nr:uncharacterized protein EI97DRAFT_431663 [Westerdykella ornata]KAF2278444.1 hypothetical protein EI97DRAFT_431663 [Westerdykella ornata]
MTLKRKPHRKSRTGCSECKRRRIKCDEEKPRCTYCVRHGSPCVYPGTSPSATIGPTPNLSAPGHPSPLSQTSHAESHTEASEITPCFAHCARSPIPSGASFELKDLALLHHWTLVTSRSILNTPQLDHFWQTVLPEIAFQHSYVMHSLLSIAALHVTYLCPSNRREHLCDAAHHHSKALAGFREAINFIDPQNGDALFASATLIFFYAFLTFGKLYDGYGDDTSTKAHTSRILGAEWIPLVRGIELILHPVYEHVRAGPLRSLLGLGNWYELDPDAQPGPGDEDLLRLREIWNSDENAKVYDETLTLLRRTSVWMMQFQNMQGNQASERGYHRDWSGPFIWLFLVPDKYFVLQQQRQPSALILFAYFGALLQRLNGYWWMEGCGKSIVGVVDECLGPYWSSWLDWPKQVVGLG